MHPTTTTARRTKRWAALALVGAFSLVAAACGDDGEGASGDFCDAMEDFDERFGDGEPTQEEVQEIVDAAQDVDPPDEIRESWDSMLSFMSEFVDDPTAASQDQLAEFQSASEEVDNYMQEECG